MTPPQFQLNKIAALMLGVKDLGRAVAFYRDKLGLGVKEQVTGFAFLDGGGVTLALSEPLARAVERVGEAVEVVFSVDDVRGAYAALRVLGVEFTHEPRNVAATFWAANFQDPDGHNLSIFGPEGKA